MLKVQKANCVSLFSSLSDPSPPGPWHIIVPIVERTAALSLPWMHMCEILRLLETTVFFAAIRKHDGLLTFNKTYEK